MDMAVVITQCLLLPTLPHLRPGEKNKKKITKIKNRKKGEATNRPTDRPHLGGVTCGGELEEPQTIHNTKRYERKMDLISLAANHSLCLLLSLSLSIILWTGRVTPPPLPPPPFYFGGNKRAPVPPTCQTQSHGSLAGLPPNNLALAPLCLLIPVSGLSRSVIARLPTATTHVLFFFFCSFSHFTIYLFICSSSAASDELDVSS